MIITMLYIIILELGNITETAMIQANQNGCYLQWMCTYVPELQKNELFLSMLGFGKDQGVLVDHINFLIDALVTFWMHLGNMHER